MRVKLLARDQNNYIQYGDLFDLSITLAELNKQPDCIEKNIVLAFLQKPYAFAFQTKKIIMQALRKYDHIKNCFELWEALDEIREYDYFSLFDVDDEIFPACDLDLIYNMEELLSDETIFN